MHGARQGILNLKNSFDTSFIKQRKIKVMPFFAFVAMLFACNPYVSPFHIMNSDIQPEALVFASCWTFLFLGYWGNHRLSGTHICFFFCALYALIISAVYSSVQVRSLGTYFSLTVFSLFGFWVTRGGISVLPAVIASTYANFLVGFVQYFVQKDFLTFLIRSARTTSGRGVTGLSCEPSYYGISCLFLFVCIQIFHEKQELSKWNFRFLSTLLMIQVVLFANSLTAIVPIGIWFIIRFFTVRSWKILTGSVLLSIAGYFGGIYLLPLLPDSRFQSLLGTFLEKPEQILSDASANERLADILYSLLGFIEQLPLAQGHGTDAWNMFRLDHSQYFSFIWRETILPRIMSGYGSVLFELGLVGICIPILVLLAFWKTRSFELRITGFAVFFSMFFAIPLATPLFGIIVGLLLAFHYSDESKANHDSCHESEIRKNLS